MSKPTGAMAAVAVGLGLAGCLGTGRLTAPEPRDARSEPCPVEATDGALACFAPVVVQEVEPSAPWAFDHPIPLDPDASGDLADDVSWAQAGGHVDTAPLYGTAQVDAERLFLFYGLYYAVDWSGEPRRPKIDHPGDFEGALVVVNRSSAHVEAVVTNAHRRFYLWTPAGSPPLAAGSGTIGIDGGRPVLFSESGGHGLYSYGSGRWRPRGGRSYARGPSEISAARVERLWSARTPRLRLLPLSSLEPYTDGPRGAFRGLTHALPPWMWADRRGGALGHRGSIVLDPKRLYDALRAERPAG